MNAATPAEFSRWDLVASQKLSRVLGEKQGQRIFTEVMQELGIARLSSADDLVRFADHLGRRGGFTAALAAVLRTHAMLRGASPKV